MSISSAGWEPEFESLPAGAFFDDESAPPLKRARVDAPLPGAGTPNGGTPVKPASSAATKKLRLKLVASGPSVLADLLLDAVAAGSYPGGADALASALPAFDVNGVVGRFEAACGKVDRNMPRFASGNNFCYNRVKGYVSEMRALFAQLVKEVTQLEDWPVAVEFASSMVSAVKNSVMSWDEDSKNKWALAAKKKLEALAVKAVTQIAKAGNSGALGALEDIQERDYGNFSPEFDIKLDGLISKTKAKCSKLKGKK